MGKPKLIPLSLNGVTGEITITANGTYDVRRLASVIVDVPDSGGGGGDSSGDEMTVNVISWANFRNIDKESVAGQIYSIEL